MAKNVSLGRGPLRLLEEHSTPQASRGERGSSFPMGAGATPKLDVTMGNVTTTRSGVPEKALATDRPHRNWAALLHEHEKTGQRSPTGRMVRETPFPDWGTALREVQ